MLPPLSPGICETNPNFGLLYKHLTEHLLAPDGSTLAKEKVYAGTAIESKLNEARVSRLADEILVLGLGEVALRSMSKSPYSEEKSASSAANPPVPRQIPSNLRDLAFTISEYLAYSILSSSTEDTEETDMLMADEIEHFKHQISDITNALSDHLTEIEQTLANMAATVETTSDQSRTRIPTSTAPLNQHSYTTTRSRSLAATMNAQSQRISRTQTTTLPSLLSSLTETVLDILQTHRATLHTQIRHLELHTHGSASRFLTSRAAFLRSVAEGIALKSRLILLTSAKDIYTGDAGMILEEMDAELDLQERDLVQREAELEGLLGQFRGQSEGQNKMEILANRYGAVEVEIEQVKQDIQRLERELETG